MRLQTPCVVVLAGPSGSGKSTWAAEHFAPGEIVSSDELRARVGIDESDQRASPDAFFILEEIARRRIARRLTTVIDTLGYDDELRTKAIGWARAAGMPVYAIGFDTPAEVCRARNAQRRRPVPKSVLDKQLRRWRRLRDQLDQEGFDAVFIVGTEEEAPSRTEEVSLVTPSMVTADEAAAAQSAAPRPLEFGLQVSSYTWPDDGVPTRRRLAAIGAAAEEAGFTSLWVMDHFRQIPQVGREWEDMLESYTTLAYLAAATTSIRLGTLVTGVTYRNPAHLGKIVATLDVLSGGRAMCGLGIGWFEKEAVAYGWDWPDTATRYDILEDTLRMLPLLWGPGSPSFEGKVISVPEAMCYPRPIQERIPILVGGSGERRTLRLVAEYADMCNVFGDPTTVAHKLNVLERHCGDLGRDPSEITVSFLTPALAGRDRGEVDALLETLRPAGVDRAAYAARVNAGTVEDHVGRFREYADAGAGVAIVTMPNVYDPAAIATFGGVIAAFSNIPS